MVEHEKMKLLYTGDFNDSESFFYCNYVFTIQKINFLLIECTFNSLNYMKKKFKERIFYDKIKNIFNKWNNFFFPTDNFSNFTVS